MNADETNRISYLHQTTSDVSSRSSDVMYATETNHSNQETDVDLDSDDYSSDSCSISTEVLTLLMTDNDSDSGNTSSTESDPSRTISTHESNDSESHDHHHLMVTNVHGNGTKNDDNAQIPMAGLVCCPNRGVVLGNNGRSISTETSAYREIRKKLFRTKLSTNGLHLKVYGPLLEALTKKEVHYDSIDAVPFYKAIRHKKKGPIVGYDLVTDSDTRDKVVNKDIAAHKKTTCRNEPSSHRDSSKVEIATICNASHSDEDSNQHPSSSRDLSAISNTINNVQSDQSLNSNEPLNHSDVSVEENYTDFLPSFKYLQYSINHRIFLLDHIHQNHNRANVFAFKAFVKNIKDCYTNTNFVVTESTTKQFIDCVESLFDILFPEETVQGTNLFGPINPNHKSGGNQFDKKRRFNDDNDSNSGPDNSGPENYGGSKSNNNIYDFQHGGTDLCSSFAALDIASGCRKMIIHDLTNLGKRGDDTNVENEGGGSNNTLSSNNSSSSDDENHDDSDYDDDNNNNECIIKASIDLSKQQSPHNDNIRESFDNTNIDNSGDGSNDSSSSDDKSDDDSDDDDDDYNNSKSINRTSVDPLKQQRPPNDNIREVNNRNAVENNSMENLMDSLILQSGKNKNEAECEGINSLQRAKETVKLKLKLRELRHACSSGQIEVVKYLVRDHHMNIHIQDKRGWNVLHYACFYNRVDIVKYLIDDCKCNISTQDKIGWDTLHIACYHGSMDVVQCLIEHCKYNVCTQTKNGWNALHIATDNGHTDIVKYLIDHCKYNVSTPAKNGWNALHAAACFGHMDIVKYLVEEGQMDITTTTTGGETAYDLAKRSNKNDVAEYLLKVMNSSNKNK